MADRQSQAHALHGDLAQVRSLAEAGRVQRAVETLDSIANTSAKYGLLGDVAEAEVLWVRSELLLISERSAEAVEVLDELAVRFAENSDESVRVRALMALEVLVALAARDGADREAAGYGRRYLQRYASIENPSLITYLMAPTVQTAKALTVARAWDLAIALCHALLDRIEALHGPHAAQTIAEAAMLLGQAERELGHLERAADAWERVFSLGRPAVEVVDRRLRLQDDPSKVPSPEVASLLLARAEALRQAQAPTDSRAAFEHLLARTQATTDAAVLRIREAAETTLQIGFSTE